MAPSKRKPVSGRPYLLLRLREGWSYEPQSRCFVKDNRDSFHPRSDLPKYTRIRFQVPAMARKRKRTSAEDELARSIQIVTPKSVPPERLLKRLQSWPCVDKVWIAPTPSPASQ